MLTMSVGGTLRSALVHVPPAASSGAPLPLVLAFHGAGSSGPAMQAYSGLTPVADHHGFIVVYPSAVHKFWQLNGTGPRGDDDVTFARALLDDLDRELCVDDSRVYATGVSNGGGFTARLGCEMSDRLAAIAPVAGGFYSALPPCHPDRPLSVLEIHGTADISVPYYGEPPDGRDSVASFLSLWDQLDGCPSPRPTLAHLTRRAVLVSYGGCAAGTTVEHVKLIGGPHIWPGTKYVAPGRSRGVPIDGALLVWRFFSGVRGPAGAGS